MFGLIRKPFGRGAVPWATTAITVISLASLAWIIQDYNAWLSFGTGGTPPNVRGYIRMTKFRMLHMFSGSNLQDAASLSASGTSYLPQDLPSRRGPRPKSLPRPLPQRQYSNSIIRQDAIRRRLHTLPEHFANRYPMDLDLAPSHTEGGITTGLYALPYARSRSAGQDRILQNEIAHVHPDDNSLHVWLTEADARLVVERGWGERFVLSVLGIVHVGWTFVYAPRTEEEMEIVEKIVGAGVAHLTELRGPE